MATRIADIARDDDGVAVSGATVSLRRELDNFELATTTTDSNGYFEFSEDTVGYPGPVKVVVTDVSGNSRQHSGRSTGQVGTIFMSDLSRAFLMMTDGVVAGVDDDLEVTATGLSMNVTVGAGELYLYGHLGHFPTATTVTIASNGTGNPRLDLIVGRLIPPGEVGEGKIVFAAIAGTPAASPVAPGETKDSGSVWEVALATVRVEPGATSIAQAKITDLRTYTSGPLQDESVSTDKIADLAVTRPKIAANAIAVAQMDAESNLSTTDIAKVYKAPTSGITPVIATMALSELSDVSSTAPTSAQVLAWSGTAWVPATQATGGDVLSGLTLSVDNEVALFSGTGGKTIKRGSLTASLVKIAAGIMSAAGASDLPTGIDAIKIADGSVTNAEFQYLNSVTSDIQTQINTKGPGDVAGPVSAVDSEVAIFSGTGGKTIKRSGLTAGIVKSAAGILSAAAASDLPTGIDAAKIAAGTVSNTVFGYLAGVTSAVQTQLNTLSSAITTGLAGKSDTSHIHTITTPVSGTATKSYTFTGVTSTATDGVEIAGFDIDIPSGGGSVIATGHGQMNAPTAGGTYIQIGVKIGSQSTTWGELTQTVSGERGCMATSVRDYVSGASSQRISLRAKVDAGSGAGVNAAHINAFGVSLRVPAS